MEGKRREVRYNGEKRPERRDEGQLPVLRRPAKGRFVLAVTCGDIHLSERAPVSRADSCWYEAMARPLRQLREVMRTHNAPLLCTGDVFDKWNPRPELLNFAIRELPRMYAIPGQHDLPYHRYEDIKKSAYWTLCEAGTITNLMPGRRMPVDDHLLVVGFPWGFEPEPIDHQPLQGFNVAMVHRYLWKKDCSYPNAPQEAHVSQVKDSLKGFRVALYGDQHKTILQRGDACTIFNAGTFMRRKSDEADHRPCVGLVWSTGDVTREYLDTSEDVLLTKEESIAKAVEKAGGFEQFLECLGELGHSTADFLEAIEQALNKRKASDAVRRRVLKAMGM